MSYWANSGGFDYYCKQYIEDIESSALVVASLRTSANATTNNYSQIVSYIDVNGRIVNQNYDIAQTASGGFYTSISGAETLNSGENIIRICSAFRAVSSPESRFSISILQ